MPRPCFTCTLLVLSICMFTLTGIAHAQTTWYVANVSDPNEDGTADHPFDAIQEAIVAAVNGDDVQVADGTYTGTGNRALDFQGKTITVRSENGYAACTIDCESLGRGFYFHTGETDESVLDGFTITNGAATQGAGVFCAANASPKILNCYFTNNTAGSGGGIFFYGSPTLINCQFTDNTASGTGGGGIFGSTDNVSVMTNCLIRNNSTSGNGGGMYNYGAPTLTSCVIADNTASNDGGGIYTRGAMTVTNSILWNNSGSQAYLSQATAALDVSYTDVKNGQGGITVNTGDPDDLSWGEGNLNADPLFVDAPAGDYHLTAASPCVNAGDPNFVPGAIDYDIDNEDRIQACRIDIGADETDFFADCNANGTADICDIIDP